MKRPCNSKYLQKESYWVPQTRNLNGIPMNIYEENSAHNFQVQSEREWTFSHITNKKISSQISKGGACYHSYHQEVNHKVKYEAPFKTK